MGGAVLLHLITYVAVATFLLGIIFRSLKIYRMPMHVRWELYPVAHEAGARAKYGGSMLEDLDWWTKPRERSLVNELKVMIPEMTFLVALFEHNRKLWWVSFPFHFGLYLLAGTIGLLLIGAALGLAGVAVDPGGASFIGAAVYYLTQVVAVSGLILATLGAAGLLIRRLTDPDLADYTTGATIFNLVFFLATFAVAWLTFLFVDPGFGLTRSFFQSLLTFDLSEPVGSALLGTEIVLAVLLIAYIPMTHMSHFFIKYFTYHKIRWDDEPNIKGGPIEKKIGKLVQYPVSWAGSHIKADGKKNWVDIATEEIAEEEKK